MTPPGLGSGLTAGYPSWQSLGVEPVDPMVMKRPPRRADDPILNHALGVRVLSNAALITAGTLYVYYKEMSDEGVVTKRDTTMTFTTFVMFDMFNAMACRHAERSVFHLSPFSNTSFLLAVGGSLIGQLLVIYFPPLQVSSPTPPRT
jgi:P-type Ca2+ transporter type 2C